MEIPIVPIGNSKGIRFSKTLIEKYNFKDAVELALNDEYLIIKPAIRPRKNWDLAFQQMHANGEDKLLIDDIFEGENLDV
jgi:antitoxin MazE